MESLDLCGNDAEESALVELIASIASPGKECKLRVLEIGGNQGGNAVEAAVKELKTVKPNLDVARDRPKRADGDGGEQQMPPMFSMR